MNSTLKILTSTESLNNEHPVIYYQKEYLNNQEHQQFVCYQNSKLMFPVSIMDGIAVSIPRSPFGSFFVKDNPSKYEFLQTVDLIKADLKDRDVHTIEIVAPPKVYADYAPESWLAEAGFSQKFQDINQLIELRADWENQIHTMQKRKLEGLRNDGFTFEKMEANQLEIAHNFIAVARQTQGLVINVSLDLLSKLAEETNGYDIFGVFRDGKISAVCITVRVTKEVAYYYLPATSPMFRTQSPMVMLIAGMVNYYRNSGFLYFDLGVTSIQGKPQESLRIFKERMGAIEQTKTSWMLQL